MSELSPRSRNELEELGHRRTFYGLDLVIRRNPNTGEVSTVAFDEAGVTEIVSDGLDRRAHDAYIHPSVTAGLEVAQGAPDLWDEALDAFNELTSDEDRAWALKKVEDIRAGKKIGPTVLQEVVRGQRPRAELNRAA